MTETHTRIMYIFTGANVYNMRLRLVELQKQHGTEWVSIDCSTLTEDDSEILSSTPSLFSTTGRLLKVWNWETCPQSILEKLAENPVDTVIAIETITLPTKIKNALYKKCTVEKFPITEASVRQTYTHYGIKLPSSFYSILPALVRDDPLKCLAPLGALLISGLYKPTSSQMELLLGSTKSQYLPWEVASAIEDRDSTILQYTDSINIFAVVGYLSKRWSELLALLSIQPLTTETVMKELSITSDYVARRNIAAAIKIGQHNLELLLSTLHTFTKLLYTSSGNQTAAWTLFILDCWDILGS